MSELENQPLKIQNFENIYLHQTRNFSDNFSRKNIFIGGFQAGDSDSYYKNIIDNSEEKFINGSKFFNVKLCSKNSLQTMSFFCDDAKFYRNTWSGKVKLW